MKEQKRPLLLTALCILLLLAGCAQEQNTTGNRTTTAATVPSTAESFEYATESRYYFQPSVYDSYTEGSALTTTTEDGIFYCMTEDTALADDFIITQRVLLRFLRENGVEPGNLDYYATNYGDSFSRSSEGEAYIALSALRTQRQVLVTLQSLWGDYVEYGYVWALSNAIAQALGWEAEPVPTVQKADMDAFFAQAPEAVALLYPTFTTAYASEETVTCCKALSASLLESLDWRAALAKPVDTQLSDWNAQIEAYAKGIGVSYTPQTIGYAYFGENVPLRIMTAYAEFFVDSSYEDQLFSIYGDYFSDYTSLYRTVNTIHGEITASVERVHLEDQIGMITFKLMDKDNKETNKFVTGFTGTYYKSTHIAYITSLFSYLHEYHHHLEYFLTQSNPVIWQSQAFCEIGGNHSVYRQMQTEATFTTSPGAELFYACTGHTYQTGLDDYYEAWDILCYINDYYQLGYRTGAQCHNSISRYLITLYGEDTVMDLMLLPDTVEDVTGKTWDTLISEWKQAIKDKYAHIDPSDWV